MTIKDLAKLAGVSTATISRALNNDPRVNPETQKKILSLADDLNYQPNILAKGLSSQKTYTIGVMICDINNPFYGDILRGIEDVATANNYSTIFFNTDYDAEKERRALSFLRNNRVDGLIAYVSNRVIDECITMTNMNYPFVMLGQLIDEVKTTKIGCNNYSSAYTITEHLIKAGHRRIAHIAGHTETKTGMQRLQGYKRALETYDIGVNPKWIVPTDYAGQCAYEKTRALLKEEKSLTAIFAANDAMAAGCYRAIFEMGLRVPEDISVVGHDDTETAVLLRPALTTMRQDIRRIGRLAAQNLFSAISRGKNIEDVIIVPTVLVERDSVKKVNP